MQQDSPHILLIDDNKHGLKARRTVLEELGYRVETASSGKQGLEKFTEHLFDLVVTDYRMPDLKGPQVVHRLRKKNDRVPIVILSGYTEKLGLSKQSTGTDAVLAKGPGEEADLVRTIAKLLKKKPRSQHASGRITGWRGRIS